MNKKFLPILIISFLLIIPIISAASNSFSSPIDILGNIFGADGYLVKWFGGDVVASGKALLAYLRIGLFLTLFTILFEVLSHSSIFSGRKNSAIAISLAVSALAAFFVGTNLYIVFITTYNTILWFVLLAIPIGAVLALNFFIIPNTNRYFIALKILLLLLLFYILDAIGTYSSNIFLTPSGTRSLHSGIAALTLPFTKSNKKFNFKLFILPLSLLLLVPYVFAQDVISGLIPSFAGWLKVAVFLGIIWYGALLVRGGTKDKENKESSGGEGKGIVASLGDLRKKLESVGGESKKESADISSALRVDAEDVERIESLEKVTSQIGNPKLKDEDREVLFAKVNSVMSDLSPPSVDLKEKLAPIIPLYERLGDSVKLVMSNAQKANKKAEKAKGQKKAQINNAIGVLNNELKSSQIVLAKINSCLGNNGTLKQNDDRFSREVSNYQRALKAGKTKLAAHHLSEMKRIKETAEAQIEELLNLEQDLQDNIHNLQQAYTALMSLLS